MITQRDLHFLNLAFAMSEYSDYKRVHIGAVIVKKNSVISTGCNKIKSHPIQKTYNHRYLGYHTKNCLHAEIDALIKADSIDCKGATLYVARRGLDNKIRLSKPCEACYNCAKDLGIKRIVYTIENGIKEMTIEN